MSLSSLWKRISDAWESRVLYNDLADAVESGDIAAVKKALDEGADPNYTPSHFSFTPVGVAAVQGTPEVFDYLIEHGGDITQSVTKDQKLDIGTYRFSLLHLAIVSGQEEIALKLASHPDVDFEDGGTYPSYETGSLRNHPYSTPLEMARKNNMDNVVAVLAERTADKLQKSVSALKREASGIKKGVNPSP